MSDFEPLYIPRRNRNMFKFKIPADQARSRDGVWRPGWKTQYFHWYWRIRIIAAWARKIENILIPHHSSIPFFPHLLGDGSVPVDVHGPEEALQRCLLTHELLERELPVKISIHPIEEFCHFLPVIANSLDCYNSFDGFDIDGVQLLIYNCKCTKLSIYFVFGLDIFVTSDYDKSRENISFDAWQLCISLE